MPAHWNLEPLSSAVKALFDLANRKCRVGYPSNTVPER